MAKRFTDSRKFNDPWYRKLPPAYKVLWEYIISTCNHAGIWKVDFDMAVFCVGVDVSEQTAIKWFEDRVKVLSKDKWFIPKFISFQYGELNPDNRVHQSVLSILQKEGAYKGLKHPLQGCKDKDKDKDKDKEDNNERFETAWKAYPNQVGKKAALKHFKSSVKNGTNFNSLMQAMDNYKKSEKVLKGFIQNGSTWFNDWESWVDRAPTKKKERWECT